MKYLFSFLLVLCLAIPILAEENGDVNNEDNSVNNSVEYYIDLGNGDGAIIVVGDGNTIYLPETHPVEIVPNQITVSADGKYVNLVLMDTELIIDGHIWKYTKLVIRLSGTGWELLWYEQ